jgi:glycosyltransferase involved in cell wall biosynthesis
VQGLLVPEKDPATLAAALILLSTQPHLRQRLGENALQRVRDSLNWQHVAEQFVAIYAEAMAGDA